MSLLRRAFDAEALFAFCVWFVLVVCGLFVGTLVTVTAWWISR